MTPPQTQLTRPDMILQNKQNLYHVRVDDNNDNDDGHDDDDDDDDDDGDDKAAKQLTQRETCSCMYKLSAQLRLDGVPWNRFLFLTNVLLGKRGLQKLGLSDFSG